MEEQDNSKELEEVHHVQLREESQHEISQISTHVPVENAPEFLNATPLDHKSLRRPQFQRRKCNGHCFLQFLPCSACVAYIGVLLLVIVLTGIAMKDCRDFSHLTRMTVVHAQPNAANEAEITFCAEPSGARPNLTCPLQVFQCVLTECQTTLQANVQDCMDLEFGVGKIITFYTDNHTCITGPELTAKRNYANMFLLFCIVMIFLPVSILRCLKR